MKAITGITIAECQGEALGFIQKHSIGTVVTEYRSDMFRWGEQGHMHKDKLIFSFVVEDLSEEQFNWLVKRVCSKGDLYIVDLTEMP